MRLFVRADDLGITEAVNYGMLKSIEDGIVRNVGLMVNMPASIHGYNLVKDIENLCVGQHTNISIGKPISDPKDIPSIVDENGNFLSSKVYRGTKDDLVVYDEAIIEIEAQLNKFIEIAGKKPDYIDAHAVMSENYNKALEEVAKKHNILYLPFFKKFTLDGKEVVFGDYQKMTEDSMYDPMKYILEDEGNILNKELGLLVFHPGYVDMDILNWSSYNMIRPLEVEALCSQEVKDWVKENNIELVNFNMFSK